MQAISIDGIFSPKNLSKQSQNEDIPGTAAKKEDQLEIVGSNKNIFAPKNTVPWANKIGDTINTIDFKVITDNQHIGSSIVIYKHVELLMKF